MSRFPLAGVVPAVRTAPPTPTLDVRPPGDVERTPPVAPDGGRRPGPEPHRRPDARAPPEPDPVRAAEFELSRTGHVLGRVRDVLLDDPQRAREMLAELATGVRARSERTQGLARERLRDLADRLDHASRTGSLADLGPPPPSALPQLRQMQRRQRARDG